MGKSAEEEIAVIQRDMPNFFVEAVSVAEGRVHSETREVVVPPEKRILNVAVLPSQQEYKPGQKATVKVKLTDFFGKPFVGSDRDVDLRQERGVHLGRLERARRSARSSGTGAATITRRWSRACSTGAGTS